MYLAIWLKKKMFPQLMPYNNTTIYSKFMAAWLVMICLQIYNILPTFYVK